MPHKIDWYIPKRVIYVSARDEASLQDLEDGNRVVVRLLDEGQAPVHILVFSQDVSLATTNIHEVQQRFDFMKHPSLGWFIGLGNVHPVVNLIILMITKLLGVHFSRQNSLEDAKAFLLKNDPTLNWENVQEIQRI